METYWPHNGHVRDTVATSIKISEIWTKISIFVKFVKYLNFYQKFGPKSLLSLRRVATKEIFDALIAHCISYKNKNFFNFGK